MKLINQGTSFKLLLFVFFIFVHFSAAALPPTVILGTFIETESSDKSFDAGISGYAANRFMIGSNGYGAVRGGVVFTGIPDSIEHNILPNDYEYIDSRFSIPAGSNRIELHGSMVSSLLGNNSEGVMIFPLWELRYRIERGRRNVRPFIGYTGEYKYSKNGDDDRISSGLKTGFDFRPVVERGYRLELHGKKELYSEQETGDGDDRQDFVLEAKGRFDAIISLFWDLSIEPAGRIRYSNLNEKEYIELALPVFLSWTPTRDWSLSLDGTVSGLSYILVREKDMLYSAELRIERSFNDKYFLYLEGGGLIVDSPSSDRKERNIYLRCGLDVSF